MDYSRQIEGAGATCREIDLEALAQRWPELATAPRAHLLLAEMIARTSADPEAEMRNLLRGEGELSFRPARVLMQDYAGLPALLDIAALRGEVAATGGDPLSVGLSVPVDLVIDHSVMVIQTGAGAEAANLAHEYANNAERFAFLKWAEQAFAGLRVVPPGMGIVHQMNIERFSQPIRRKGDWLIPDSLVGTDSHSTMCGGLGILGWGVGGIEATAVLLDLPVAIPAPKVTGVRLIGQLSPMVQATDLALCLTKRLRDLGVVGEIIEFYGEGLQSLSVADRASIANMAPEYGATAGFFPADEKVADFLASQGQSKAAQDLRGWLGRQRLFSAPREVRFAREIEFDLSAVGLTISGPKLPHQTQSPAAIAASYVARAQGLQDGDIVLAAITSCTITSNPRAMVTAGLLARNALEKGLQLPARIKASFSPGSRKVSGYLEQLGLLNPLKNLGFAIAGYGCMTCVGNSGELNPALEAEIARSGANVAAVLSGNRNFEARIHPRIAHNYLMSPALVIAQSLLGHMREDITSAELGQGLHLADIWPSEDEVQAALAAIDPQAEARADEAMALWQGLEGPKGPVFAWPEESSFFRAPEAGFGAPQNPVLENAAPLLILGEAITTDHISPVGRIALDSPAGKRLAEMGISPENFGAYGARRGNPEIMRMGTFANPRLENALVEGRGWFTRHLPSGEVDTIEATAARYRHECRETVVLAGENYGIGSARDWAAKGTAALGIRAVIAKSFERIHRTNLALVGVLPLQLLVDWPENLADYDITLPYAPEEIQLKSQLMLQLIPRAGGEALRLPLACRLDTDFERKSWAAGGMLALARETQ